MTKLLVRAILPRDSDAVAGLSAQLGYPATTGDIQQRLASIQGNPQHGVFVAEQDGVVAGWIHVQGQLSLESGPCAEITGLVVDPGCRRGGVGRALVEQALRWAAAQQLARVRVRSNVTRVESHVFYPALGFALKKTQHTYELVLR